MKNRRHEAICTIIKTNCVNTQSALAQKLKTRGFDVAQTTVSRDIKELKLVKVPAEKGGYKYTLPESTTSRTEEFAEVLDKNIISVICSESMIILRTLPATATLVAQLLDSMNDRRLLGTVSGYDTVFAATDSTQHAHDICEELKNYVN